MEYRYIIVQSVYGNGSNARVGYGIAVVANCDDITTVLNSVPDLSVDIQLVAGLVERCNSQKLDPIHLQDVVADFLATV